MKKVIIYGNTVLSQMIYCDSISGCDFQIAAFAVDQEYLHQETFCGLPQIDIEIAQELYPPDEFDMLAVLGGYSCIRNRSLFFNRAKSLGYLLRNYMSNTADISLPVSMGENNIIMGGAHVGCNGQMGNNNLIRQNVYLGHDFVMGDHNVIGPGCNIGGHSTFKNHCYVCISSTLIDNIVLEEETLIGAGSVVIHSTEAFSKNVGNPARILGYHKEDGIRMTAMGKRP